MPETSETSPTAEEPTYFGSQELTESEIVSLEQHKKDSHLELQALLAKQSRETSGN